MVGEGAAWLLRGVASTLRWQVNGGAQWSGAALLSGWHGDLLLGAALLLHLGRAAECHAPIVPEYGQSGPMRAFARALGLHPVLVPGYERAAERRAALLALRPILVGGQSLFLAADGHRAPAGLVREDAAWLAAAAGVPLLPVTFTVRAALRLPTWDRKRLPLPGARVVAQIGPPCPPEPGALAAALTFKEAGAI